MPRLPELPLPTLLLVALLSLALLPGCATVVPAPAVPPPTAAEAEAAFARVLAQHVDERGYVDFAALARQPTDLERYVAYVARTPLDSLAHGTERLAHAINSYNALSMYNVLLLGVPDSHAGAAKIRFFVLRKFDIGGQPLSLYSYENDWIRPLGDPRVHFVLNCSAVSCPKLPRVPFSAAGLEVELEREAYAFFARPDTLRIDHATQTVWVSEILDFFAEDFVPAHASTLLAYIDRYAQPPVPQHYRLRFIPYDWTIANQSLPRR
jgi:hypothetical protein